MLPEKNLLQEKELSLDLMQNEVKRANSPPVSLDQFQDGKTDQKKRLKRSLPMHHKQIQMDPPIRHRPMNLSFDREFPAA